MRLICPNCGAQYEVADDVIPDDGRDVQCSSCGHTWFESHGASSIEDAFADILEPAPSDTDDVEDETWDQDIVETPSAPVEQPTPAPERQELDPAIADILREEAAREAEARRVEAEAPIETQPDLGLDTAPAAQPDQQEIEAQRRMASLRGEDAAATTAAASATRKELLPDIEEINSSLRSNSERDLPVDSDAAPIEAKKSSGFRRGFLAVLVLLLIALLVYLFAPQIADAVPTLAPTLDSYVAQVDALRLWLDAQMQGILASISGDDAATQ